MRIDTEIVVERSQDEVFDYLADVENEAAWNPWAKKVEKISDGPIGAGARFRGSYKRMGVVEQELADYDRPRQLAYLSDSMGGAKMVFELQPATGGTRVTIAGDMNPGGLLRLALPLMRVMMKPHLRDIAAGIKGQLESSTST
jgi:carbon monoxide dehydrogenase subunit G